MNKIWRPWLDSPEDHQRKQRQVRFTPYRSPSATGNIQQQPQFRHPVRLLWTKGAYDYMYASGETLLRNFPVQATIQVVDSSDGSDDEDDEELECDEKENEKKVKQ
ncbi:protein ripply1-like [Stylophora pistillata]|uniref:Protein ripply n=1 Tax=Stylophora pistillata TaxID=50429 RepID=A0A2B4SYV8_STYPI|nr:protein ripply1-like [Stylophora pistillata]PFX33748.1 Protein ripply [Stylophora pistillata]